MPKEKRWAKNSSRCRRSGRRSRSRSTEDCRPIFINALANQLASLGRPIGLGIAMDPRTGAVLSMVNLPGYDNNVFSEPGQNAEIQNLLTSSDRPLFNRAVNGYYNPGSTIKPLDAVAALSEGVIEFDARDIFSRLSSRAESVRSSRRRRAISTGNIKAT